MRYFVFFVFILSPQSLLCILNLQHTSIQTIHILNAQQPHVVVATIVGSIDLEGKYFKVVTGVTSGKDNVLIFYINN